MYVHLKDTNMENEIFNKTFLIKLKKRYLHLILKFFKISLILIVISNFYGLVIIPSESMLPNLLIKDMLIVNKGNDSIKRQDIVIFNKYNSKYKETLIKRVIGIEGDYIEIKDGKLYMNDKIIEEKYVPQDSGKDFSKVQVPKGCYFLLGDNRYNSLDSRFYGSIEKKYIIGKAIIRVMPFTRIGKIY